MSSLCLCRCDAPDVRNRSTVCSICTRCVCMHECMLACAYTCVCARVCHLYVMRQDWRFMCPRFRNAFSVITFLPKRVWAMPGHSRTDTCERCRAPYIYTCIYKYIHVCMYTHVSVCMYIRALTHASAATRYTYTHVCMNTYMYACIRMCQYVCIYAH